MPTSPRPRRSSRAIEPHRACPHTPQEGFDFDETGLAHAHRVSAQSRTLYGPSNIPRGNTMSDIRAIAAGLRFPEGPVAMKDGSIVLVEIERQTVTRVH